MSVKYISIENTTQPQLLIQMDAKPASPTAHLIQMNQATSPDSSVPSPVKFADISKATTTADDAAADNYSNTKTATQSTTSFATTNKNNPSIPTRRRKKNVSQDDNYKTKRRTVDPSSLGNIKGKLRMLTDSRNLRFRKLYKSPNPKVMWIFLGMVITWYCLFKYFGPQYTPIEYKPSTSSFNPSARTKLNHREKEATTHP